MAVVGVMHDDNGKVCGVKTRDMLTGEERTVKCRALINAAGCFVDEVMQMDEPGMPKMVVPSQGVHIVLDMKFLQSDYAIMVPKTSDGRVLFAVPWHDKVVVGTTDIPRPKAESEPRPLEEEIDFILKTASFLHGSRAQALGYSIGIRRSASAGGAQEGGARALRRYRAAIRSSLRTTT